ncbi:MAG: hypothetical protein WAU68_05740 [Vitreimonas sp.]
MRTIVAALVFACLATSAIAQTAPAGPAAPPASCADLAPAPSAPDGATATAAQMTAANQAYQTWREQSVAVVECRRVQYNALVDAMNAANMAWGATIAAYCGRRNMHCERIQQPETPATPTH